MICSRRLPANAEGKNKPPNTCDHLDNTSPMWNCTFASLGSLLKFDSVALGKAWDLACVRTALCCGYHCHDYHSWNSELSRYFLARQLPVVLSFLPKSCRLYFLIFDAYLYWDILMQTYMDTHRPWYLHVHMDEHADFCVCDLYMSRWGTFKFGWYYIVHSLGYF